MSRQKVTVLAIVGEVRYCEGQAFLTSEHQSDVGIGTSWAASSYMPPIGYKKATALISQCRRFLG